MKKMNQKVIITSILFMGLFVGLVKGQESRSQWVNKMKERFGNHKLTTEKNSAEVDLDDFEIASFHKN